MFSSEGCKSQNNENDKTLTNRRAVFAGQFYAANPDTLKRDLDMYFAKAEPKKCDHVMAIISPHAGYVFSGKTAASAFNQIDGNKKYDNIFVITTSHRTSFEGASVYYLGNYITPLGEVKVNRVLAKELIDKHNSFTYRHDAHAQEHSLEVQLPFLQHVLKTDFQIVPIVIGTQSVKTIEKISEALKPYFNANNLFIISTDFSHYPTYEAAKKIDHLTAEAIVKNKAEILLNQLAANEKTQTSGLATSLCGWSSVLTLLKITEADPQIKAIIVDETNSGDSEYGEKNRVVGYAAIAFSKDQKSSKLEEAVIKNTEFSLSEHEKQILLDLARETLIDYIPSKKVAPLKEADFSANLKMPLGVFVSLYKNGSLRGCIGRFFTDEPLYKTVQQMVIASSTEDYRFSPVSSSELKDISIEISVLTPMKRIYNTEEIELGKHGIYIKKGNRSGTFLPQVATETGWTLEEFLGHCARDKAGIGWDGWKDAEIYIYAALVFGKK